MFRRPLAIALLAVMIALLAAGCVPDPSDIAEQPYRYAASRNSDVFHYMSCRYVKTIKPSNLVRFQTREAAILARYRPCAVCRP